MRAGRVVEIVVVSVASIIVIATVVFAASMFMSSGGVAQRNTKPPEGPQTQSPVKGEIVISQLSGPSSFLYLIRTSDGTKRRLTSALSGIESEASFSPDGKLVVYSFAISPESKSSIWIVGADGQSQHQITGEEEDALHPSFSPDSSKVFYGASSFTGRYSPIVGPARHDWDLFSRPVNSHAMRPDAAPTRLTLESLYDFHSLDVSADGLRPGGVKLLVSTTGYPIGALVEEFNLGSDGRNKLFQPHVPGEPRIGPSYGEARFIHDGMDVLFLAATDSAGANYDYNVYSMSDVTGSEIKQLTHLKGMTTDLKVFPNGTATFVNSGVAYVLDISTQSVKAL